LPEEALPKEALPLLAALPEEALPEEALPMLAALPECRVPDSPADSPGDVPSDCDAARQASSAVRSRRSSPRLSPPPQHVCARRGLARDLKHDRSIASTTRGLEVAVEPPPTTRRGKAGVGNVGVAAAGASLLLLSGG
jgi:hypothetical protein